jgi:hypothetical protein
MLCFADARASHLIKMMLAQARAAQVRGANLSDEIPDGISLGGIRLYRTACRHR